MTPLRPSPDSDENSGPSRGATVLPSATSSPDVELVELLGEGRTSHVWRARLRDEFDGLAAGTEVAIKVLRGDLANDADARETLHHEREASRAVYHGALARARYHAPHGPVPPFAEGAAPEVSNDRGRPWLLLDLVPGVALDEWLQSEGIIPEPLVRAIGARLAHALAAMHAAGWVHGDVKPANVRLNANGDAVLVDLGFARRAGSSDAPLGTPGYLAPERAGGGPPVASADLFALGCLLYEIATGVSPSSPRSSVPAGPVAGASAAKARRRPPSDIVPRVSPLLDSLTTRLLGEAPRTRPTARDTATILEVGEASRWWRDLIEYDAAARRDTVAWSGSHGLPLVARGESMAALHDAWDEAHRAGVAVLLTGERGSGKSRLVAEFAHRLRQTGEPPLYLYGRCDAITDERPGAPLLALLRRWLHLPRGADPGSRAKLLLEECVSPEVARTLLAALAPESAADGAAEVTESFALGEWILGLRRRGPTIIFLDDVQFAGATTLAALQRVARHLEGPGLMLVLGLRRRVATRNLGELSELRSRLAPYTRRIDLMPLEESEVLTLVEHLFHHAMPRLRIARVLHERTGGLPGSIGELLRLCRANGWTRPAPSPGRGLELLISPDDLPRPEGVRTTVAQRLQTLTGRARIWLERLAVVGSRLDPNIVEEAWPAAGARERSDALAELVRAGWIVSSGGAYRFAHPIEREEALAHVAPRRLVRAHLAVADALTRLEETHGRRPSYRRAYHLREAGEDRRLLDVLPGLIQRMRDGGHPRRRATLAGWGLEALDNRSPNSDDVELRRTLLEALADAADRLGERDEQRAALDALEDLDVDPEAAPAAALRVYLLHGRHAFSSGRFDVSRGLLKNAASLAHRFSERIGDAGAADRAEVERLLARIEAERGAYEAAALHATRALDLAPDEIARAEAHAVRGEVEIHQGRLEAALRRLAVARRELRRRGRRGLRERAARAGVNLIAGRAWRLIGRQYRAERALERAWELSLQSGEGRIQVEVAARRGRLLADAGELREAELILRDALFTARRIEDRRGEALAALFLGVLFADRDDESATGLVERARRLGSELGLGRVEALALAVLARLARAAGDLERALERATAAWTLVERHGAELPDRIVCGATLALVLSERGAQDRARELERLIEKRIAVDNARLRHQVYKVRHETWTRDLLRTALSPVGPLYPRVRLED